MTPAPRPPGTAAWVDLSTPDVEASRRFYEALLGWSAREGEGGYWLFEQGGEEVAGLMAMPAEVPAEVPSYWLAYFAVGDVDTAVARAGELGGSALAPPMSFDDMRFAVLQDPQQAVFGVLALEGGAG